MLKVAALLWIVLGTVMAGVALTVVVTVPALAERASLLIPIGCAAAFLLAIPASYVLARSVAGNPRAH